jgi:hypothetical protein
MSGITKGERAELRSVVKQQFKVLRAELEQREAEMQAEIDQQVADRFAERDKTNSDLTWRAQQIVDEANRALQDLLRGHEGGLEISRWGRPQVQPPTLVWSKADKTNLRRAALSALRARVEGARLRLDRTEADLLRELSVGALESDEARTFLSSIPAVGELVPTARLAEIEAALTEDEA